MLDRVAICCSITGWISRSLCSRMRIKQPVFWLSGPQMGVALKERGAPMGQRVLSITGTCLRLSPASGQSGNSGPVPAMTAVPEQKGHGSPASRPPPKSFSAARLRKTTSWSPLVTITGSGKPPTRTPRLSTGGQVSVRFSERIFFFIIKPVNQSCSLPQPADPNIPGTSPL